MIEERPKITSILENFQDYMSCFDYKDTQLNYQRYYDDKYDSWWKHDEFLSHLQNHKFFNIFTLEQLTNTLVCKNENDEETLSLQLLTYRANSVMFMEKGKVGVLLGGSIELNSHKDDINSPITLSNLKEGDIIASPFDTGASSQQESWLISKCKTIVAVMSKIQYVKLWKEYHKPKMQLRQSFVSTLHIFNCLSAQTKFKVYNLCQRKKYNKGELICSQNKSSDFNFNYICFRESQASKVQAELAKVVVSEDGQQSSLFKNMVADIVKVDR